MPAQRPPDELRQVERARRYRLGGAVCLGPLADGRLVAAVDSRPRFYGQPLVAWQPAAGADQYEVQWSPKLKLNPWKTAGIQYTWGTSLTLPLSPGTWY